MTIIFEEDDSIELLKKMEKCIGNADQVVMLTRNGKIKTAKVFKNGRMMSDKNISFDIIKVFMDYIKYYKFESKEITKAMLKL